MWRRKRPDALTPREREVVKFIRMGLTNEEIAVRLGITVAGVKYHVSQILSKLGVANRGELASWRGDGGRWYWKLAWLGGASVGVAAVAGVAALLADKGRDITLELGDVAANSITGPTFPTPIGRASQDQSAPTTASPSSSPPAAGQSARASSLTAVGPGGEPPPAPTPTPTEKPTEPAPMEVDAPSLPTLPAVLPTPTPAPTPEPQGPRLSLDMDPTGNSYSDPGAGGNNSMAVGPIDNCLSTAAPGNNLAHNHQVDVIIEDVQDLIGWQARMNYDGGKLRPQAVNFAPFTDTLRGQNVSFQNVPIDATTDSHREVVPGQNIPAPASGPQTALIGSVYGGTQNSPVSPDTPPKSPPDDSSYSTPAGGVVARVSLRVEAGNAGDPSLFMNLDDGNPKPPGSEILVFTGSGIAGFEAIELAPSALGDGYHGEGPICVPLDCVTQECALRPALDPHTSNGYGGDGDRGQV